MTIDDYIVFLEENGIGLLDYQKFLIKKMLTSDAPIYFTPCRGCGWSTAKLWATLYKMYGVDKNDRNN